MALAYIGLGGNIGDTKQLIKDAIMCFAQRRELKVLTRSCMYQSAPIGCDGQDFINAVISLETELTPHQLLTVCQQVENDFGRERPFLNAPRTLDLDLLAYDQVILDDEQLQVPHPRMVERAFVLLPLLEIEPNLSLPRFGKLADYLPHLQNQRIEKIKGCCCPSKV
ncbi:MAG: 2-amino-4-hydroxy-6-hydroxymethyldihydropteridine diphosphokinase [Burkholderiaceae bacterium]|jgi:2-amino-4-hydroxy-6-hydroxymethyldihydropteridine diphosphokinase|uniref:2-amino-4-hydroxy-6- hydroxymethyldihydropteridine diphosphokinase n=1 Tax=Polynucleobacter sp. MWH-Loch1C5 TaxID=2689108 RepID=UPI001C0C642B|nr:2-amino-4-hydroxy-6-hydroxymethyldihydropteridine diphosphokinase [Polynucleobacter sp. MWH-Loch1C5]MBU3542754.1 2-amino-4-hydroxy-6-hydroxymethyldihydropteridine diphosphokinase [Polynucleobacter sp. MWH-Loch1C5]NBV00354.1 2-amino-4-hydroxy-6-hydroxymethyldihydropteridine diphosphokinase [Burkholderiaceae bacterium]